MAALAAPDTPRSLPMHLRVLRLLTAAWSWIFLFLILAFFEGWAWSTYGRTFIGNLYNVQSVLLSLQSLLGEPNK